MAWANHQSALQELARKGWTRRGLWAWSMWPFSLVFGMLSGLRRWLYQSNWLQRERVDAIVVVVGNVLAGGVGKTPVVIELAKHLQTRGWSVGVVSRGFGRTTQDCREVSVHGHPDECGDEPLLIRQSAHVPVFVARRRADAARALLAAYPATQGGVWCSPSSLADYASGQARDAEVGAFSG